VTFKWIATGTIAVYTAVGCYKLSAAQLPAQFELAVEATRFAIPAGILEDALRTFSQTTGIAIELASEGISKLTTPGFTGRATPQQALDQLLSDSGVHARFTTPTTAVLELNTVDAAVEVTESSSALTSSLSKFTEPLRDTAQTIAVINQEVMEEQGVTTLRDALRNVAGISIAAGEAGAQGDNLTIRGFSARNDLYIDGMRDFGSYYRDPFNLDSVEVVQGPASATFGRGSTGGAVNQATKAPALLRNIGGTLDAGTDSTRRATTDINLPYKTTAFRLNLMGNEGGAAGRDIAHYRRYGIAPSLAFGLGTPTRVTLSLLNQQADDTPDYGLPWLFNQPAPVDRHNFYGFANGNYLHTKDNLATTRAEHDFNAHLTIRNQTRYARYVRDVRITEPQIPAGTTLATPLSSIQVTRNQIASNSVEAFLANQSDATVNFQTGRVRHTLVTGVELDREDSDPTRPRYTGVPATNLVHPNPSDSFAGVPAITTNVHTRSSSIAAYAIDTAKFGRHWEVSGSFRYDRFNTHYTQAVAPAAAFSRLDRLPSWRAAVVYKPIVPLSVYVSGGNSWNPSAESLSLSAGTANLPPEESRTYETGVKWDTAHPGLSLRTALFRTDKLNAREPDPANSLLNVLAGRQRVNGFQTELSGHVTGRWEARASYAWLDATLVASRFYPAAIGAQLANVPRHTFAAWNNWQLPWRVRVGFGANFAGARTASSTVPIEPISGLIKQAPSYWVFNAMAEYKVGEHAALHANVYNLADRYYYDQLHPSHIVPGPARSALMGIRFKF
jgi:catecholate siderophore receptor